MPVIQESGIGHQESNVGATCGRPHIATLAFFNVMSSLSALPRRARPAGQKFAIRSCMKNIYFSSLLIFLAGMSVYFPVGFAQIQKINALGVVTILLSLMLGLLVLCGVEAIWLLVLLLLWSLLLVYYRIIERNNIVDFREIPLGVLFRKNLQTKIFLCAYAFFYAFALLRMLLVLYRQA
ncbi:MAG: hypothetical protein LBB65_05030 [Burkholderiales bacterium]|nr:hypothetical protein [Burkholderiales bacterium]